MSTIDELRGWLNVIRTPLPWKWIRERNIVGITRTDGQQGKDGHDVGRLYAMEDNAVAVAAVNALPALLAVAEAARRFHSGVTEAREAEREIGSALARLDGEVGHG